MSIQKSGLTDLGKWYLNGALVVVLGVSGFGEL